MVLLTETWFLEIVYQVFYFIFIYWLVTNVFFQKPTYCCLRACFSAEASTEVEEMKMPEQ